MYRKSGMVAKYGSSTLLTALESSSDNKSEGSNAEEDCTTSDDELAEVSNMLRTAHALDLAKYRKEKYSSQCGNETDQRGTEQHALWQ